MTEKIVEVKHQPHIVMMLPESKKQTGKFKKVMPKLTVEPLILLFCLSSTIYKQITQNLYLEKTCRVHLAYNTSVCDAMTERIKTGYTEEQEVEVQKYVSEMVRISKFIRGVLNVSLILFLGSWSDRHNRRKPLILIPLVGELTAVCLLVVNTIFFEELPVIFSALSLSLPPAITGGWPCFFLGVYSYVSFISEEDNKTARIGSSLAVQNIAFIIGLGGSGLLLKPLGFLGIYFTCFLMLLLSLIYGFWRIEDINLSIGGMLNHKQKEKCFFSDFFSMKHFFDTLKICFKKGPNKRRQKIIVIMLLAVAILGSNQGEQSVTYLYTRFKFGWSELDFSIFFVLHSLGDVIGSVISIAILSKYLQWKDASLGIIGLITTILCNVLYALGPNATYFYAGIILDIFYETPTVAVRSLMAKSVPSHEIGQANSILGLCEALMPSIFGPIYTTVYEHSIVFLPGLYYFISFGMNSIGVLLFVWLFRSTEENVKIDGEEEEEGLNQNRDIEAKDECT